MKIAYFTDTYFPEINGVAYSVSTFAKLLKEQHKVRIYAPAYKLRSSHAVEQGIEIIRFASVPLPIYKSNQIALLSSHTMVRSVLNFHPDVIHIHTPGILGVIGLLLAKRRKVPLIGTYHTLFSETLMYISPWRLIPGVGFSSFSQTHQDDDMAKRLVWKATTTFYNQCQMVIVPTESIGEELVKHGLTTPIRVISNGVDSDVFVPKSDYLQSAKLLYVGRLGYEKNIHIVLEAFRQVILHIPQATLTICGEGPSGIELRKIVQTAQLEKKVSFKGWVKHEQLVSLYQNHTVFVTASTMETQGLVLLEAMACGIPVIAVDKYATRNLIRNGENGFLVPPFDARAMARVIIEILSDVNLQKQLGSAARQTIKAHNVHEQAHKLSETYLQLVKTNLSIKT